MNISFKSAMEGNRRSSQIFLLVSWISIFFLDAFAQQSPPPPPPPPSLSSAVERFALLDLRSSLGLRSKDWPLKSDPCLHWKGVQCRNGRVRSIKLSGLKRTRAGRLSPSFTVDALTNLTQLVSFNASGFSLPGSIPDWFGIRLMGLQVLDLQSCRVSASIPFSLGNLTTLRILHLSDNNLAGSVPFGLGMLMELKSLDLSHNSLTGSIPPSFASLRKVTRLELSSNYFSGPIPETLGSLHNLQFLNLSDNNLAGTIPSQLGNLSRLVELDLSRNSLSGSLPEELKGLRHLRKMVMADNGLQGTIAGGLFSSLAGLEVVDLNGNRLDGALPGSLLSIPKLYLLDVSSNNITGNLPVLNSRSNATAAKLNFSNNLMYGTLNFSLENFGFIDLSNNYFQGRLVNIGTRNAALERNCLQNISDQRSLQDCRLFYTQRGLTFDSFGAPDTVQPPFTESDSENKRRWVFILAGVLGGVGFMVVLVLALILFLRKCNNGITNQRGTANVGPIPEGDNPPLPKNSSELSASGGLFTYDQLLQATSDFTETNLIKHGHSGDLFRGVLEGGTRVVIKKVNLQTSKEDKYMAEPDLLRKVSHPRLIPLLGYCIEHESDRFLVYKYMPNADLASCFYRVSNADDGSLQSLDWITRLKIAIGAAEGLSYLHHECSPPLVHRDVQAGSILLDDQFEVRLGSFSETQVQAGDPHQSVFTRFLRKQQASDPGPSSSCSAAGPASCSYDVYCFGLVLLELVTGKLGISKPVDNALKEWLDRTLPFISSNDRESVSKIVDPSLIVDEDLLEEVWAMAIIARSCLNPKPSKRPPMKYVLKALENPWKIVRDESFSSARLRTTSSRRSWSSAFFGSWRLSSSERSTVTGHTNREGLSASKQSGQVGSHGSWGIEHLSSNKRLSNEVFPELVEMQEMERSDEH